MASIVNIGNFFHIGPIFPMGELFKIPKLSDIGNVPSKLSAAWVFFLAQIYFWSEQSCFFVANSKNIIQNALPGCEE